MDRTVAAASPITLAHWQHRFTSLTFWNGRIGEIRPLILLGLGEEFSDPFWNSGVGRDLLVDDPVDGGAGDAMSLGDLPEALPVLTVP